ncbi:MAG TPA: hypothetical protein VGE21_13670 [Flavobacteriales bacterium]
MRFKRTVFPFCIPSLRSGHHPCGLHTIGTRFGTNDNETWTGLAIMTLGTFAGGYMPTNFSDDRRNSGDLYLVAGVAGGMSLMLGSGLRNRNPIQSVRTN